MSSRVRWLQGCYSTQTLPGRQGSLHTLTWNGCISDHTHFHTRISSQACTAAACMPSHAKTHTRRHTQDLIPTRTHSLRYIPEAKSILSPHVLISIYVPFLLLWKWRALVRVIMAKHDMHGPGHVKIGRRIYLTFTAVIRGSNSVHQTVVIIIAASAQFWLCMHAQWASDGDAEATAVYTTTANLSAESREDQSWAAGRLGRSSTASASAFHV